MTAAPSLTDFLLARITEDEESAPSHTGVAPAGDIEIDGRLYARMSVVRFNSERVLAECEAKRRIVESECSPYPRKFPPTTRTMKLLALPYADHPDYRDEWRP